jgi:hypothetical protein
MHRGSFSQSQWKKAANKASTCSACVGKKLAKPPGATLSETDPLAVKRPLEAAMLECNVSVHLVENGARQTTAGAHERPRPLSQHAQEKLRARQRAYAALAADLASAGPDCRFLGVDCEGTDSERWRNYNGSGAQLVQVSSQNVCIVEALSTKREDPGGGLSDELRALMCDQTIAKVFCDMKGDVSALNAEMDGSYPRNGGAVGRVTNTLDVQSVVRQSSKVKLGLAQVLSCVSDGLVFEKKSIKKEKWWRLRTVRDMVTAEGFVQYSAADAWGTWLCYELIRRGKQDEGGSGGGGDGERPSEVERYRTLCESLLTLGVGGAQAVRAA